MHSLILVIMFLLSNFACLLSQENNSFQVSEQKQASEPQNQDSILNENTNLRSVWERSNKYYFPNRNPYVETRYNQMMQNGKPLYFNDILSDPSLDPVKFPITFQDTVIMDPMFLPIVFDGKLFVGDLLKLKPLEMGKKFPMYSPLKEMKNPFEENEYARNLRHKVYWDAILTDPSIVKYSSDVFSEIIDDVGKPEPMQISVFSDLFKVENTPDFSNVGTPTRYLTKRKYWFITGADQFQISQTYISENWYKGGVGNMNLINNHSINFNYKKDKIQNNNLIEWKLSLYTNPNDTLRETKIGTDLFRTYSDFGFKAFGDKWFYSVNLELKTQLFNNYIENSTTKTAAFMSPFFLNMGVLGMKYQLVKTYKDNKYKNLTFNADLSPLSIKYIYVRNDAVDPARYGILAGKNDLLSLGSQINSTLKVNFNRGISFSTRFKCFTDYNKIELESENELNMAINRYFSTRIFLYARFDDSKGIAKDPTWGYWQINEVVSFGLNYTW